MTGNPAFLETGRLLFRTHRPDDEPDFVAMHTDPRVRRWVGGSAWPLEKAIHRFQTEYLGHPSDTYGLWATVLKAENKYIGCCGLRREASGHVKLAFYLARPYWGQGLATEAGSAFVDLAFSRLGLDSLFADVQSGNDASERVMRKLGFVWVSSQEIPGRILDLYQLQKS